MSTHDEPKINYFGVKTGEGSYTVFHTSGVNVRAVHQVTTEPDASIKCTCPRARFHKDCLHTRFATENCDSRIFNKDTVEARDIPRKLVEGELGFFVEDGRMSIVDFMVRDLSAQNLVIQLTSSHPVAHVKSSAIDTDLLDVPRIVLEMTFAHKNSVDLTDGRVKAKGDDFSKRKDRRPVPDHLVFDLESATPLPSDTPDFDPSEVLTGVGDATKDMVVGWKSIKKPDPRQFYVADDVWEALLWALQRGRNALMIGPSGCGKTELAVLAATALGRVIEPFNMGAMSEPRTALIGATHYNKEKGTFFTPSRFVKSVTTENTIVLTDEISRCGPAAFNILFPIMDRQGYLALDESEEGSKVHRASGVCFVGTANLGMEFTGTEELDVALKQRYSSTIECTFPPPGAEASILVNRCHVVPSMATRMVDIATRQRTLLETDGKFSMPISTRMLIAAGEMVHDGVSLDNAFKFAVTNQFSGEGGEKSERAQLKMLLQKGGAG